jgi:hypothetical protein
MSIFRLQPNHPLAAVARSLGYGLAVVCLFGAAMAVWLRRRKGRKHYSPKA